MSNEVAAKGKIPPPGDRVVIWLKGSRSTTPADGKWIIYALAEGEYYGTIPDVYDFLFWLRDNRPLWLEECGLMPTCSGKDVEI